MIFTSISQHDIPATRRRRRANSNWPPFEFAAGLHLDDGYRATRVSPLLLDPPLPSCSNLPLYDSPLHLLSCRTENRTPTETSGLPSLACFPVGLLPSWGVRCYPFSSPFGVSVLREYGEWEKEQRREDKVSSSNKLIFVQRTVIVPFLRSFSPPTLPDSIFACIKSIRPCTFKILHSTRQSVELPFSLSPLSLSYSGCSHEIFARNRRSRIEPYQQCFAHSLYGYAWMQRTVVENGTRETESAWHRYDSFAAKSTLFESNEFMNWSV